MQMEEVQKMKKSIYQSPELQWSKIVVVLMDIFLQAASKNEYISWADDFARLYLKFHSDTSENDIDDDCLNKSFETYFYQKISQLQDWSDCVYYRSKKPTDWCKAWINISQRSTWKNTRSKQFNQDLKTLVRWLWKRLSTQSHETKKKSHEYYGYIIHRGDSNQLLFPQKAQSILKRQLFGFLSPVSGAHSIELRRWK